MSALLSSRAIASISASVERVGIEHDARGIAGEAIRGEGVDLEDADAAGHAGREFYPQTDVHSSEQFPLTSASPRGGRVHRAPA